MSEPQQLPLKQIIEGAILAADTPLGIDHMISLFDGEQPTRAQVREVLASIAADCEGRGFELKEVASGFRFQVRKEYGEWIGRLWEEKPPRYSRALLETLALIAYRQPITRGDIEEVRGVTVSTNIIRTLLEREWIRVVGHRDVPGRPAIYATTRHFLDYFDLSSLDQLPTLAEIRDLDRVSDELDFEEDTAPQGRVIETPEQEVETTDAPDAVTDEELDRVSERVEAISDNITNLFKDDDNEEEVDSQGEGGHEMDGVDRVSEGDEDDAGPDATRTKGLQTRFPNVPQEILDAAFQDDEDQGDSQDHGDADTHRHGPGPQGEDIDGGKDGDGPSS
ncbi:MAG: SMC-Scp complex subunit ScpB [Proteobacteria bacterium]|nr:SMC-Scp complex subunit ScpB [Pseudomonadota bacterium]MDA1301180.1 SMC-Scp complex subunit ScpB [Pseudomonadota bacterium]